MGLAGAISRVASGPTWGQMWPRRRSSVFHKTFFLFSFSSSRKKNHHPGMFCLSKPRSPLSVWPDGFHIWPFVSSYFAPPCVKHPANPGYDRSLWIIIVQTVLQYVATYLKSMSPSVVSFVILSFNLWIISVMYCNIKLAVRLWRTDSKFQLVNHQRHVL